MAPFHQCFSTTEIILLIIAGMVFFTGGFLFACFLNGAFGKSNPHEDMEDYYNNISAKAGH